MDARPIELTLHADAIASVVRVVTFGLPGGAALARSVAHAFDRLRERSAAAPVKPEVASAQLQTLVDALARTHASALAAMGRHVRYSADPSQLAARLDALWEDELLRAAIASGDASSPPLALRHARKAVLALPAAAEAMKLALGDLPDDQVRALLGWAVTVPIYALAALQLDVTDATNGEASRATRLTRLRLAGTALGNGHTADAVRTLAELAAESRWPAALAFDAFARACREAVMHDRVPPVPREAREPAEPDAQTTADRLATSTPRIDGQPARSISDMLDPLDLHDLSAETTDELQIIRVLATQEFAADESGERPMLQTDPALSAAALTAMGLAPVPDATAASTPSAPSTQSPTARPATAMVPATSRTSAPTMPAVDVALRDVRDRDDNRDDDGYDDDDSLTEDIDDIVFTDEAEFANPDGAIISIAGGSTMDLRTAGSELRRAQEHESRGEYRHALALYTKAAQQDPDITQPLMLRGDLLRRLGRWEEALEEYDEAVRRDPTEAEAHYLRGYTRDELGRYEDAIADFSRALELSPGAAQIHVCRGVAYQRLKKLNAALEDYTRALQFGSTEATTHLNRGIVLQQLGRLEEASEDYKRALQLDPSNPIAHFNAGLAALESKDEDAALEHLDRAIDLMPDLAAAYLHRGRLHAAWADYEKAVADLTEAIELDPVGSYDARVARCDVRLKTGKYGRALHEAEFMLSWNPDDVHALLMKGLAQLGRNEFYFAQKTLEEVIARDKGSVAAHMALARSFLRQEKPEKCVSAIDAVLTLKPDPGPRAAALTLRAAGHHRAGRPKEALADLETGAKLDPQNREIVTARARVYMASGRYQEALTDASKALQLNPRDHEMLHLRGQAALKLGDHDRAMDDLTRAAELADRLRPRRKQVKKRVKPPEPRA